MSPFHPDYCQMRGLCNLSFPTILQRLLLIIDADGRKPRFSAELIMLGNLAAGWLYFVFTIICLFVQCLFHTHLTPSATDGSIFLRH